MESEQFRRKSIMLSIALWLTVSQMRPVFASPTIGCPHHFGHKVKECLGPYWTVAALFSPDGARHNVNDMLAEHLCVQFEIALMCLHSALTDCPSHANVKYVQSKLGSDWAMDIRGLCVGQSGLATNQVPGEEIAEVEDLFTSSGDLLQDDLEEDDGSASSDDKDVTGDEDRETVVVVPKERKDVYREIIVDVRRKVKLRTRHNRPKSGSIDINIINIFEDKHETQRNSAGEMSKLTVSCLIIMILFVRVF